MRSKWARGLVVLVALLIAAYAVMAIVARPAVEHPYFAQFQHAPLVMAHRGGKGLWPENTLFAFERAVAMGVDVLEMDIHSTADGVLVVMHDSTVDRTTNGSGPIHALTLGELKELDAGYDWSADDGQSFPFRGRGISVPALEEVFASFPAIPMNIEIKQAEPSIALELCQLIRDYAMEDSVLVASFHEAANREFRYACPEVASTAYENEVLTLYVLSKAFLGSTYTATPHAVQVPERRGRFHVLTPRFVDAAHNRDMQVHAWTINDLVDMQRMRDLGVDGIITDYPDRLLELLGRR